MNYISQQILALVCFRILLVFIAILSAYSIHLLLRSAGVVGKPELYQPTVCRCRVKSAFMTYHTHICVMFVFFQAFGLMSSLGIGLLVPQEKCWPRASLQCTTLEVL